MSSTPIDDYEDLTSCHFLLGQSSFNQSPGDFNDSQTNLRTKWKAVQADTIMFWSRSTKEYLPTLGYRKMWTKKS